MNYDEIPLMGMLKGRLNYISQREQLIAQNVANADTPGYAPKDLKPFTLPNSSSGSGLALAQPTSGGGASSSGLAMVQPSSTNAAHLAGTLAGSGTGKYKPFKSSDTETTLDGNKVTLEDQMAKMTASRMDYEAAIGFYTRSMAMLRLAVRKPGG